MTQTPSYGIWTTDLNGKRVAGFTPAQMLSVTQERDELLAALQVVLRDYAAVHDIGDIEMQPAIYQARAVIQKATNKEQA